MTFENRINQTCANSYEVRCQALQVRSERLQLKAEFRETLYEWRIARMKQQILLAEIRKSFLMTGCVAPSVRDTDLARPELRIQ
jgi:hypothetical protein